MAIDRVKLAKYATIYAGVVFGIYWMPLRGLATTGISGIWTTLIFYAVPTLFLLPVIIYRHRSFFPGRLRFHGGGAMLGLSVVLYSTAYNYTDVVRVVLLFYLMPVWGFLLARIVIGEPITLLRWLAMAFGIGGALIIFGADVGMPLPHNIGDWMALASGLFWAIASLMLLTDDGDPVDYGIAFFLWAFIVALIVVVLAGAEHAPTPRQWSLVTHAWWWVIPVALLVILPSGFATVYGPTQLNPGTVGILFMAEIVVAIGSAAMLTGEPFGLREFLGVAFIMIAGSIELFADRLRVQTTRR